MLKDQSVKCFDLKRVSKHFIKVVIVFFFFKSEGSSTKQALRAWACSLGKTEPGSNSDMSEWPRPKLIFYLEPLSIFAEEQNPTSSCSRKSRQVKLP